MIKELSCVIVPADDGKQIRDIMRRNMELSDKQIRQAKFRTHGICLNGEPKYTTATVAAGDKLVILLEETVDSKIPSSYDETIWNPETGILYEDEDMIAVNKPAGVVSHPSPGHYNDSMASLLTGYYERKGTPMNLRCIGRLDKDTSGVLLLAKNQVAADRMSRQRIGGALKKEYLALAKGKFAEKTGTINMGITKIPGEIQARIDADGKPAVTHYEVEKEFSNADMISLVRLRLETGRTHQIRLHLSWQGHPLLGDSWYGGDMSYCERAALHAEKMELIQPFTQEKIVLRAELPEDMKKICADMEMRL